jgi:hypothetical protein
VVPSAHADKHRVGGVEPEGGGRNPRTHLEGGSRRWVVREAGGEGPRGRVS